MRNTRNTTGQRLLAALLCLVLVLGLVPTLAVTDALAAPSAYRHDPRLNPKAMADIQVDPAAIYGFSPTTEGSLKEYAENFDWTDPQAVERGRQERVNYHKSLMSMYDMLLSLQAEGKSMEEIARAVSAQRNVLRMASYENDPEGLAAMKARNLATYGREEGPTPDEMYEKYGAWETVIEKAFSVNLGMDVCLGLYDENYAYYLAMGLLPDEETQKATREYAVSAFLRASGRAGTQDPAPLAPFSDAGSITPWFRQELTAAVAAGLLKGYEDGTLRPGDGIRRVEALCLLARCLPDLEVRQEPLDFSDVPPWAAAEIDRLSAAGLVLGYGDGRLGADDPLTVEQVGLLVGRVGAAVPDTV